MKIKFQLLLFLLIVNLSCFAKKDSTNVLSLDTFLFYVKNYHPIARQANLKIAEGKAALQMARGNFDPKISSTLDEKYYGQKEYFQYFNAGLSIPTWAGIDIKTGYNNTYGDYINPELKTPEAGLYQIGVSIPVLQGLLFDQRRNAFRQAEVYCKLTATEQQLMRNDLILEATTAYWNWYQSYQNYQILSEVYNVNQQRFAAIKSSVLFGDRPMLDTLEASVQLQERYLSQEQAHLEFIKRSYEISSYLWLEDETPLILTDRAIPMMSENNASSIYKSEVSNLDEIINRHPQLNLIQFKIQQLEFDKKWKQEQLKPLLNLNYNALNYSATNADAMNYNLNNYKWGFTFSVPVLLRKERGSLQLANIKLKDAHYDQERKSNVLMNKILSGKKEIQLLNEQLLSYQQTVVGYEKLLAAENTLFERGESTLFFVNARETNMINARLKLVDLQTKQQKSALLLKYNMGNMVD